MKFKVGQKVKVKDFYDIAGTFVGDHETKGLHFAKEMVNMCGKTYNITNIRSSMVTTEKVIELAETGYVFVEEWLEPTDINVTLLDIYRADEEIAFLLAKDIFECGELIVVDFAKDLDLEPNMMYRTTKMSDVELTLTQNYDGVDAYLTHAVLFEGDAYDFFAQSLVDKICKKMA